jgi:hypothetical protein
MNLKDMADILSTEQGFSISKYHKEKSIQGGYFSLVCTPCPLLSRHIAEFKYVLTMCEIIMTSSSSTEVI